MGDLTPLAGALLALLGLAGGIGITAIGPGGVLPTVGLVALSTLSPAQVAGTSIVTHVATGALGTAAYLRSGELRVPQTRRTAWLLAVTALIGTVIGIRINAALSPRWFSALLGVLVAVVAALVLIRNRAVGGAHKHPPLPVVLAIGLFVAVVAGIIGIGGPMLTVPLLVAAGCEVLEALAVAQAQSVVIATVGTIGYLAQGSIDWPVAVLIGVPELAGVLIGWRIARALPTRILRNTMVVALFALAPYLAFR
ncbi:sulfite exporter TauE/SafE family protein [Kribbella sp. NPDC048928]|uniref:sulfite exporter TauE/SafE family protein n=1 Tax=Kribbella sp. NPDC048928 TaxID=3364111 RepID=UPI00371037D9